MAIEDYRDIIDLPYTGKKEGGMSMYQRAAQFAPFAALTGHNAAIRETARLTDCKIELDEEHNTTLNETFAMLRAHLSDHPLITVTYFQPDALKSGGSYQTLTDYLRNIDDLEQTIIMKNGGKIPISSVFSIESKLSDKS